MTFGEKLHKLRKSKGMSQEELASQITVSRQAVSKWELNESIPDTDNVILLSKILGVSIDYLLNDDISSIEEIPIVIEMKEKTTRTLKSKYQFMCIVISITAIIVAIYMGNIMHIPMTVAMYIIIVANFCIIIAIIKFVKGLIKS